MGAESLAGIGVDRIDDPDRRRIVGVLQFEHRAHLVGEAGELVLDDRAVGNAAGGRHALRQRLALALGVEPGHRDRALRARVDRSVRRLKLGEQQRPAHQRRGVAERRNGDVEPRARLHSGGRSVVTITEATLRLRSEAPCTSRPRCSSIACTDCSVKGALRRVSPDPCNPTTRP